ncbi:patatin-like phospholipase family protein [Algoriphagus sp. AGSA1]|uniref:patatin-like phospholipase family protein n=1 Tax=Algoriphagus sp. AGSA1 TaxID=2907213 RepID=UPI001F40C7D6|nr:patatin-like phospholipase family protein [Algoriphagus sp. AGSA1]MCE7053418.1 patatin-like phospholipase family protein [Algoriphagus sp. AGSA1]
MLRFSVLFFLIFFCFGMVPAISQSANETEAGPKIGLVLSGGGAKGIAHVGILKSLEKAGIRPDYIVGTSMGAVVGGLYSLGYSADQLEEIIESIDWGLVISNRVSFKDIAFEEKEYYNRYLVEFPMVEGKIAFPSGLIEGQVLSDVLHYFTWPANSYRSFDDFPIPFRCVATDIRTGKAMVFDGGYLQDAIRASIAIPTAFTAFQLDSTSVVDGGVVNNFPVDVVREMGADIVIGVNVSFEDFQEIDELGGFGGILMQLAMAPSLSVTQAHINATDIYIKPDLKGFSTGSFSAYSEILEVGVRTGEEFYPQFQHLADSLGRKYFVQGLKEAKDSVRLGELSIVGNRLFSTDLIRSKLDMKEGDQVNREELEAGVRRVFGMNGFYKVDYTLEKGLEDEYDMKIRIKEKPSTLLSTAIHYDDQFSAGVLLNLTARDVLGHNSRTVLLADVSENPKLRLDYYKYTGVNKNFAFNFRVNHLRQQLPIYENGEEEQVEIGRNTRIEMQVITTSSLKQAFYLGGVMDLNRSRYRFSVSEVENLKSAHQNFLGGRGQYYRNSQNDRNFPTNGAESLLQATLHFKDWLRIKLLPGVDSVNINSGTGPVQIPVSLLDDFVKEITPNPYLTVLGRYTKFFSLGFKWQLIPEIGGAIVFSGEGEEKIFSQNFVGGYQNIRFTDVRFRGLNYAEVQTSNYLKVGADFQYIPFPKIYLRAGANMLGYSEHLPFQDPDFFNQVLQEDHYLGYGADISYQSILGPISAGLGSNSKDRKLRAYFSLGFSFNYSDR